MAGKWLKGLKIGSEVAVACLEGYEIRMVTGETPSHWKVGKANALYSKNEGKKRGGSIYDGNRFLIEPTDTIREGIARDGYVGYLGSCKWENLPTDDLAYIYHAARAFFSGKVPLQIKRR